jgi:predicted 3-demethylubiquinone-9 3-methyltransferase (glyoxalase superfamily)
MALNFRLTRRDFQALNGGPQVKFSEAVSFSVSCETQAEIDALWDTLVAGGSPGRCGWLKDRYGLSWQVVPATLGQLMTHSDPAVMARVMAAFMGMHKFDIAALEAAAAS